MKRQLNNQLEMALLHEISQFVFLTNYNELVSQLQDLQSDCQSGMDMKSALMYQPSLVNQGDFNEQIKEVSQLLDLIYQAVKLFNKDNDLFYAMVTACQTYARVKFNLRLEYDILANNGDFVCIVEFRLVNKFNNVFSFSLPIERIP